MNVLPGSTESSSKPNEREPSNATNVERSGDSHFAHHSMPVSPWLSSPTQLMAAALSSTQQSLPPSLRSPQALSRFDSLASSPYYSQVAAAGGDLANLARLLQTVACSGGSASGGSSGSSLLSPFSSPPVPTFQAPSSVCSSSFFSPLLYSHLSHQAAAVSSNSFTSPTLPLASAGSRVGSMTSRLLSLDSPSFSPRHRYLPASSCRSPPTLRASNTNGAVPNGLFARSASEADTSAPFPFASRMQHMQQQYTAVPPAATARKLSALGATLPTRPQFAAPAAVIGHGRSQPLPSSGHRVSASSRSTSGYAASAAPSVDAAMAGRPGSSPKQACGTNKGCLAGVSHAYPLHFTKGTVIQLANGVLKRVEDLNTEDFAQSARLSQNLRIDASTVVRIEEKAHEHVLLGFSVGDRKVQVSVDATREHPFFVIGQGWSSCSPERTKAVYGLHAHRLQVGDICISLTLSDNKSIAGPLSTTASKADEKSITIDRRRIGNGDHRRPPSSVDTSRSPPLVVDEPAAPPQLPPSMKRSLTGAGESAAKKPKTMPALWKTFRPPYAVRVDCAAAKPMRSFDDSVILQTNLRSSFVQRARPRSAEK